MISKNEIKFNWKVIGIGFIVTLVLAYIGNYVPYVDIPLAPIIAGVIVGYIVGGSYRNGIINGGLSAGIAGFIYTLAVIVIVTGSAIYTSVAAVVAREGFNVSPGILSVVLIIIGAIIAFIIYFILGLIGGIIGVAIKERNAKKPIPTKAPEHVSTKEPQPNEN